MLLKGLVEVDSAPDRRAAAEMVLIRLCHVSDLPPPADLIRRLTAEGGGTIPSRPAPPAPSGGSRMRASGGGAMAMRAPVADEQPAPRLAGFRDVVALCSGRDPTLHSHLRHSVHLVRFAPGVIELRPEPVAPRDLASRLGALLLAETGTRWTIALSTAPGEPTIGEQGRNRRCGATRCRGRASAGSRHPGRLPRRHDRPGAG